MKNFRLLSAIVALLFTFGIANAQNISISDVSHTADASAVLDVYSTSLGMLVPRLSSAPSSPATGLLYYDTGSNSFKYNAGTSTTPSWTELSYGNLWSRTGTDTYLTNMGDNVVIGTNSSAPGYKFYVFGAASQMSRFDGQVEFWSTAGGNMYADLNVDGFNNGLFSLYDNTGTQRTMLSGSGNCEFNAGAVGIGTFGGWIPSLLTITDQNGFGAPQIMLNNVSGTANTAIGYQFGTVGYSQGIDPTGTNFTLANNLNVTTPSQGDGVSLISAFPSGIIDFNNQSRSRVFQADAGQAIPSHTWQPIDFNMSNYDQQVEWILGAGSPAGGPPVSFFTAKEEGYYQVNARTEYFLGEEGNNWWVSSDAYVSIAIFKGDTQGNWTMYAQGNNLQIGQIWNPQGPMEEGLSFKHNNAPNVSDVVYLQKGESIAIYTWQSSGITLNLIPGSAKTYCSIHKSS